MFLLRLAASASGQRIAYVRPAFREVSQRSFGRSDSIACSAHVRLSVPELRPSHNTLLFIPQSNLACSGYVIYINRKPTFIGP